nr:hypothetical protein BN444_02606 [Xanthomonas translucens pv. translucens DSM 18974]
MQERDAVPEVADAQELPRYPGGEHQRSDSADSHEAAPVPSPPPLSRRERGAKLLFSLINFTHGQLRHEAVTKTSFHSEHPPELPALFATE